MDSNNSLLEERIRALERINSDMSVQLYELNEKLRNQTHNEEKPSNVSEDILEQYRHSILMIAAERDSLLLQLHHISPGLNQNRTRIKKMKSTPNITSNNYSSCTHNQNFQEHQIPSPSETNFISSEFSNTMISNDCMNILSNFDIDRKISITDIKEPIIFESQNSWTYMDKRITVCFLPKKPQKQIKQ